MTPSTLRPAVLLVAYHFAPENTSGTHRPLHFARALHEAGWDVHVLTVTRNHVDDIDPALESIFPYPRRVQRVAKRRTLGQRYAAVTSRLRRATLSGGVMPAPAAFAAPAAIPRRGLVRRVLSAWESFPDQHRSWRKPAVAAGVALGQRIGFAAVIATGPPWTSLQVGADIAQEIGAAFIADFRDPWTERLGSSHPDAIAWLRHRAERAEARVMRQARLVLFNSPSLMEASQQAYPAKAHPPRHVILNGSDAPRRETAAAFPDAGPLVLRHFGTLYRGRSVTPVVEALQRMVASRAISAEDVVVELIGSDEIHESFEGITIPIKRQPLMPHAEALRLMMEPALLLLVQPPTFGRQIPTKLFEYLCTGNPVLTLAGGDSATWQVAQAYERAFLLEDGRADCIEATLRDLVFRWRAGVLRQARTVDDTAALSKRAVGRQLVSSLEIALGRASEVIRP